MGKLLNLHSSSAHSCERGGPQGPFQCVCVCVCAWVNRDYSDLLISFQMQRDEKIEFNIKGERMQCDVGWGRGWGYLHESG